jgi:hypothetical protein
MEVSEHEGRTEHERLHNIYQCVDTWIITSAERTANTASRYQYTKTPKHTKKVQPEYSVLSEETANILLSKHLPNLDHIKPKFSL